MIYGEGEIITTKTHSLLPSLINNVPVSVVVEISEKKGA